MPAPVFGQARFCPSCRGTGTVPKPVPLTRRPAPALAAELPDARERKPWPRIRCDRCLGSGLVRA